MESLAARFQNGELTREEVGQEIYLALKAADNPQPPTAAERMATLTVVVERATFAVNADEYIRHAQLARRVLPKTPAVVSFFADPSGATGAVIEQENEKALHAAESGTNPWLRGAISLSHTFLDV